MKGNVFTTCYKIKEYENVLTKTCHGRGGGLMLQLTEGIEVIEEVPGSLEDSLLGDTRNFNNRVLILIIYYPLPLNKIKFIQQLDEVLENISRRKTKLIVMGDLNIDILHDHRVSRNFLESFKLNGLEFNDTNPTRIGTTSETCIDHIITSESMVIPSRAIQTVGFSDHYSVANKQKLKNYPEVRVIIRKFAFSEMQKETGTIQHDFRKVIETYYIQQ